jgi:mRNA-degrading endonuclease toxin of MazEF toxin-antitoxin module
MCTYPPGSCFKPGEIYKILLAEDGYTEEKYVLVVSREKLNRGNGCTTVMFTTKKVPERSRMDNCVFFEAGKFGLTEDCVVKCESVQFTYYDEFVFEVGLVNTIDDRHWKQVVKALGYVMDACCKVIP